MRSPLPNLLTRIFAHLPEALLPPFASRVDIPLAGTRFRVRRRFSAVAIRLPIEPTAARFGVSLAPTTTLVIHPATAADASHVYATIHAAPTPPDVPAEPHILEVARRDLEAFCLLE